MTGIFQDSRNFPEFPCAHKCCTGLQARETNIRDYAKSLEKFRADKKNPTKNVFLRDLRLKRRFCYVSFSHFSPLWEAYGDRLQRCARVTKKHENVRISAEI